MKQNDNFSLNLINKLHLMPLYSLPSTTLSPRSLSVSLSLPPSKSYSGLSPPKSDSDSTSSNSASSLI